MWHVIARQVLQSFQRVVQECRSIGRHVRRVFRIIVQLLPSGDPPSFGRRQTVIVVVVVVFAAVITIMMLLLLLVVVMVMMMMCADVSLEFALPRLEADVPHRQIELFLLLLLVLCLFFCHGVRYDVVATMSETQSQWKALED